MLLLLTISYMYIMNVLWYAISFSFIFCPLTCLGLIFQEFTLNQGMFCTHNGGKKGCSLKLGKNAERLENLE